MLKQNIKVVDLSTALQKRWLDKLYRLFSLVGHIGTSVTTIATNNYVSIH